MEQPTVLTEKQFQWPHCQTVESATHTMMLHPGSPLTTAQESLLKGLRYSTEMAIMEIELEMLTSAFRMNFQLLATRCFLAAPSLAILLDLALMDNTLSSQAKRLLADMSLSRRTMVERCTMIM